MIKTKTIIKSTCIPLQMENVDTDQIIPARFLKVIDKAGFGKNLFRDWRFDQKGNPKKDFVLNNPIFKGEVLVAGRNFGCGSSREHAAWAISDFGFSAVVSSFFADIFRNNALINHLLPVQVSDSFLKILLEQIEKDPKTVVSINIPEQTIQIEKTSFIEKFPLDPYRKMCFIKGFDDIDYLLNLKSKIQNFEKKRTNNYSLQGETLRG